MIAVKECVNIAVAAVKMYKIENYYIKNVPRTNIAAGRNIEGYQWNQWSTTLMALLWPLLSVATMM